MNESYEKKVAEIKKIFSTCSTPEQRYLLLIELGRKLPPIPSQKKTPDKIVSGCQSTLHLIATFQDGKVYFEAASDALISAGLAALLISAYSGESPEVILKIPPLFLQEIGITASLSPNRSNGLSNIHIRMKQDALKFLVQF